MLIQTNPAGWQNRARHAAPTRFPESSSTPRDSVTFSGSRQRDLGDFALGLYFAAGGGALLGATGAAAGAYFGAASGHPGLGLLAGLAVGGVAGMVAGWHYSAPN
jgi:hypothetical protein